MILGNRSLELELAKISFARESPRKFLMKKIFLIDYCKKTFLYSDPHRPQRRQHFIPHQPMGGQNQTPLPPGQRPKQGETGPLRRDYRPVSVYDRQVLATAEKLSEVHGGGENTVGRLLVSVLFFYTLLP